MLTASHLESAAARVANGRMAPASSSHTPLAADARMAAASVARRRHHRSKARSGVPPNALQTGRWRAQGRVTGR